MNAEATMWTTVAALIAALVTVTNQIISMKRAKQDREQDRLDKQMQLEQRKQELAETREYRKKIASQLEQTKQLTIMGVRKADHAYHTANNINEKLAREGVKLIRDESVDEQTAKISKD